MKQPIIILNHITKTFQLQSSKPSLIDNFSSKKHSVYHALTDISFSIHRGEKIGIIGDNGSGKSTLLKIIAGITTPSAGTLTINGKIISIIDITAGFDPELSGLENLKLNALLLNMSKQDISKDRNDIIEFSGLGDFIYQPLHTYSSGMILRLGFAIAIHADPEILVLDENIIVGDQEFQKKLFDHLMGNFFKDKTVIFSSHMLSVVKQMCHKIVWLEKGRVKKIGNTKIIDQYKRHHLEVLAPQLPAQPHIRDMFMLYKKIPIGQTITVTAGSTSMEPFILQGQKIIIQIKTFGQVMPGDIIAFWHHKLHQIVVHRCLKRTAKYLYTKGDNNLLTDNFQVTRSNFLGAVVKP